MSHSRCQRSGYFTHARIKSSCLAMLQSPLSRTPHVTCASTKLRSPGLLQANDNVPDLISHSSSEMLRARTISHFYSKEGSVWVYRTEFTTSQFAPKTLRSRSSSLPMSVEWNWWHSIGCMG